MTDHGWLEQEDETAMDGSRELSMPEQEYSCQPVRPTLRCKRCGCWLNSANTDGEYCASCLDRDLWKSRPCFVCGKAFIPEGARLIRCPVCEHRFQVEKRFCQRCGGEFLPYTCMHCSGNPTYRTICHACHWRLVHEKQASVRERVCRVCGCRFLRRRCIVPGCETYLIDICSVCHEEAEHMGMIALVWTLPDCPRCEAVIETLERQHRKVTRLSVEKLVSGEEPDVDALAHLAITGNATPIVFVDERFLDPEEVAAMAEGTELAS